MKHSHHIFREFFLYVKSGLASASFNFLAIFTYLFVLDTEAGLFSHQFGVSSHFL